MKFPLSWLRRYLRFDAKAEQLAQTMTMIGMEVEHISDPAQKLAAMSVARVVAVEPHPNADRLSLCSVETVEGPRQIVCGAPNVVAGMLAVYVPLGSFIPGSGVTLDKKPRSIRGVESHGMLCSEYELGTGQDHDGIIALEGDFAIGEPAAKALGLDDPVFEIEVTPNRPDLLGVLGIARDLAAAGFGEFADSKYADIVEKNACPVEIRLTAEAFCPLFALRMIRGVKNGSSPDWLVRDLAAAGMRSRNILVDISNFLAIDRARPLHVFDADRLEGNYLHIRTGQAGEKLSALDGNEYALTENMCVIADASGPVSIGGIMGGASSAVDNDSCNILIESAWFDPGRTARAGRILGIDSQARRRFERGVDPDSIHDGLDRATRMIVDLCGGEASNMSMVGTVPKPEPIRFQHGEVKRLAGFAPPPAKGQKILTGLGCKIDSGEKGEWLVTPPCFRGDLRLAADLVEEIARIEGYEKLPATPLPARPIRLASTDDYKAPARRIMAARGFVEMLSWSFMDKEIASLFYDSQHIKAACIANPIAENLNYMRPGLIPNLAAAIAANAALGEDDIRLFEAGSIWLPGADGLEQKTCLTALASVRNQRHWASTGHPYDHIAAKGDLLALLAGLDQPSLRLGEAAKPWHPGKSGGLFLGKKLLACFGELDPRLTAKIDVELALFGFELYMDELPRKRQNPARPQLVRSGRTPIIRDFAFETDETTPAGELARIAALTDRKLIAGARIFDVYRSETLGKGRKSVAMEVTIKPAGANLTDQQINAICEKIIDRVSSATNATLRQTNISV